MTEDRTRIVVDLDPAGPGEPVSGSAAREGEPHARFEGMLGFLSLFERLRGAGRGGPATPTKAQEDQP
jgi:hypothetical protein